MDELLLWNFTRVLGYLANTWGSKLNLALSNCCPGPIRGSMCHEKINSAALHRCFQPPLSFSRRDWGNTKIAARIRFLLDQPQSGILRDSTTIIVTCFRLLNMDLAISAASWAIYKLYKPLQHLPLGYFAGIADHPKNRAKSIQYEIFSLLDSSVLLHFCNFRKSLELFVRSRCQAAVQA